MENQILLDSNILIAAFRRDKATIDFLERKQFRYVISDITIMELLAGCKTVEKRAEIEKIIKPTTVLLFQKRLPRKPFLL